MKKICLIKDERKFWGIVEKFLGAVNAATSGMSDDASSDDILGRKPDLLITNALFHHRSSNRLKQYPTIVIKEGTPPVTLDGTGANRNLLISGWPIEKSDFLAMTSRMLSIPPRKTFRTIIRVYSGDDSIGTLGRSEDFSLSGVAFRMSRELAIDTAIEISVTLPDVEKRMRFQAVIKRSVPVGRDDGTLYGASFSGLSAADEKMLAEFILSA